MKCPPLPFRPPPLDDELLSSWLSRLAKGNHCDLRELCCYVGFEDGFPPDRADDRGVIDWRRLKSTLCIDAVDLRALQLPPEPRDLRGSRDFVRLISPVRVQVCRHCVAKAGAPIELRHWRWGGSINCQQCGARLTPTTGPVTVRGAILPSLHRRVHAGAAYLNAAIASRDHRSLRRARLAVRFAAALLDGPTFWSPLFSPDRYIRLTLLAAISRLRRHPIQAAVIAATASTSESHWRLQQAFPERPRAVRMVTARARQYAARDALRGDPKPRQYDAVDTLTTDRLKVAVQWAMSDLGHAACERALLKHADRLLQSMGRSKLQ